MYSSGSDFCLYLGSFKSRNSKNSANLIYQDGVGQIWQTVGHKQKTPQLSSDVDFFIQIAALQYVTSPFL